MMDLLVQITTNHNINPGGHVIQVINERSSDFLYYKPSTPIGKSLRLAYIYVCFSTLKCLFVERRGKQYDIAMQQQSA